MSDIQESILEEYKKQLAENDDIPDKLVGALTGELEKESPNAEKLSGIIQLKKGFLSND